MKYHIIKNLNIIHTQINIAKDWVNQADLQIKQMTSQVHA
jgi:hypothetical protein